MVAVKAFIERAAAHAEHRSRAQLKIVSPIPEYTQIPVETRATIDALYREIDRVLQPVIEAPTIETADELAIKGFEAFVDLWPAAIGALLPWLQDHPDRIGALSMTARNLWRSDEALRLGEATCEWFAAAQSARQALADAAATCPRLEEVAGYTLLADFALALGALLVRTPSAKPAEGLALSIAKLAHASATNAFAAATMSRFADQAS